MRFTVTQEQDTKILAAIGAALGPGCCEYVTDDDEPGCVVAQICALEGVGVDDMRGWDTASDSGGSMGWMALRYLQQVRLGGVASGVDGRYPSGLLSALQHRWDNLRDSGDALSECRAELAERYTSIRKVIYA